MVWDFTDNLSTPAYDGQNEIHNYIACENLAKRKANKAEFETGFGHKH